MIVITDIADEFETVVRHFNSIDSLSQAKREVSVQHGREILEKLRILAEEEDSDKEELDIDETRLEMAQMLLIAAKAFLGSMAEIARNDRGQLSDKNAAPAFEKTVDAIGKVSYKVRDFVVNMLVKQGKQQEADEMRGRLEAMTPARFKGVGLTVSSAIISLETGIIQADLLEKKVTAELRAKRAQKKEKANIQAQTLVSEVGGYHTIIEMNEKRLVPAAQTVRGEQEKSYSAGPHKVTEVNKEKLVKSAQVANEGMDKRNKENERDFPQGN